MITDPVLETHRTVERLHDPWINLRNCARDVNVTAGEGDRN